MTLVTYEGPDGQANHEIGLATGGGDLLEQGAAYDVPEELADRLVASSHWFSRVSDYDRMTVKQLRDAAADRDVPGRARMSKPELIAALRHEAPGASPSSAAGGANGEPPGEPGAPEGAAGTRSGPPEAGPSNDETEEADQ